MNVLASAPPDHLLILGAVGFVLTAGLVAGLRAWERRR